MTSLIMLAAAAQVVTSAMPPDRVRDLCRHLERHPLAIAADRELDRRLVGSEKEKRAARILLATLHEDHGNNFRSSYRAWWTVARNGPSVVFNCIVTEGDGLRAESSWRYFSAEVEGEPWRVGESIRLKNTGRGAVTLAIERLLPAEPLREDLWRDWCYAAALLQPTDEEPYKATGVFADCSFDARPAWAALWAGFDALAAGQGHEFLRHLVVLLNCRYIRQPWPSWSPTSIARARDLFTACDLDHERFLRGLLVMTGTVSARFAEAHAYRLGRLMSLLPDAAEWERRLTRIAEAEDVDLHNRLRALYALVDLRAWRAPAPSNSRATWIRRRQARRSCLDLSLHPLCRASLLAR